MASPKPQCSSSVVSSEDECVVQVLDSYEPLVTSASSVLSPRVQVLDSNEPLVTSASAVLSPRVQVLDSNEPLVTSASAVLLPRVQVLDSNEPLVLRGTLPDEPSFGSIGNPGPSTAAGPSIAAGSSTDAGSSRAISPSRNCSGSSDEEFIPVTGSSGRRVNYTADELRSQWSWQRIYKRLGTTEQCIQFAEERGLIPTEKLCSYHRQPMTLTFGGGAGHLGKFRCRKSNCRNQSTSRAAGTWFENIKLPITVIFQIMFAFSDQATYDQIKREVAEDDGPVLSSRTVADWYNYCRETIVVYELEHQEEFGKIGGPGKVVQIDESKFGKRKYNRGLHIEGHWVIGMIEDKSDDLRLEVCPDNERSAEVLIPLIQKHVEVGSIIHTDFWRAYLTLPDYGYIHKRVNHSDPENRFIGPDGTHTQRIESQWRGLKKTFRQKQNKKDFTDWLIEYLWRRKITVRHGDPFEELINAIKYVYPGT